jgi:hypothetical protein
MRSCSAFPEGSCCRAEVTEQLATAKLNSITDKTCASEGITPPKQARRFILSAKNGGLRHSNGDQTRGM